MKKLGILLCCIFISCENEYANFYFSSQEIYNIITTDAESMYKIIAKPDEKMFYVQTKYDTLIIMSAGAATALYPIYSMKMKGYFDCIPYAA